MKTVVSISLGSSKRNHEVKTSFLNQDIVIKRIGTDGNMEKAIQMVKDLDGKVDAFGMGGIDLYVYAGNKRYILRDAKKLKGAAQATPMVDGSGLKNTLERRVINHLAEKAIIDFRDKKVLLVSGVDRFGMGQSLEDKGAQVICGDLIFGLGLPIPIKSLKNLERVARIIAPIASQLPFSMLYPTGSKQEESINKFGEYYDQADIIAGDFLFIKRYLPPTLQGKTVITNTVTNEDIDLLKSRGVVALVTTTPELQGRSFGTNVMEAVLVALSGKREELDATDYNTLLDKLQFTPRVINMLEANFA